MEHSGPSQSGKLLPSPGLEKQGGTGVTGTQVEELEQWQQVEEPNHGWAGRGKVESVS